MDHNANTTFDEYTRLYNLTIKLHEQTEKKIAEVKAEVAEVKAEVAEVKAEVAEVKAEVKELKVEVNNRFNNLETDLKIIKNLLLQTVENNGLKAIK